MIAGLITGVSIRSADVPDEYLEGTFYNVDIYLCHTDRNLLTVNFNNNYVPYQPTHALATPILDIDWSCDQWQPDITFETPFTYDGVKNFIIEFSYAGYAGGYGCVACGWYPSVTGLALEADEKDAVTGGLLPYTNWLRFTVTPAGAVESSSLGGIKAVFR